MNSKQGYEFSFTWIFAILAGGIIIFIAVYTSVKFAGIGSFQQGSEVGKEIGVLLTPFETSIESGKTNLIKTREETTIYNDCIDTGEFGEQKISAGVEARIGNENSQGARSSFKNRYLFSDKQIRGREFYVISKPFDFPFKVGDVIVAYSDKEKYCFVDLNSMPELNEEIRSLKLKNIENVSSIRDCSEESKKVCFRSTSEDCDIVVDKNSGRVKHIEEGEEVFYDSNDDLLYAAIFADPEIYDCQIRRLMKRASNIANLYVKKSQFLEGRGCGSPRLNPHFAVYLNNIGNIAGSQNPNIKNAEQFAIELGRENELLSCELF